ncbi:hypothetical protein QE152_g25487 [Popillia japonica]|uniref:FlgN protein n=1 Tax=Popillia japonica TaxID=7064 RepID=A0AAW1K111_POPJA
MEHRSNKQMTHVDFLSRICVLLLEDNSFERNLSIKQDQDVEISKIRELLGHLEDKLFELRNGKQDQDVEISKIRELLGHLEDKLFELRNGLVYRKFGRKSLFYVPKCMEQNIIRTYHELKNQINMLRDLAKINEYYTELYVRIKSQYLHILKIEKQKFYDQQIRVSSNKPKRVCRRIEY